MGLFDNVGNIFDLFMQGDQRPETQTLAKRADVNSSDFSKIAALGLPAILQGINRNNQSDHGLDAFHNTLTRHQDVQNYNSLNQLTETVNPQEGDKILGHVFNDKQSIFDRIGDRLGLSPAAVQRVLVLLAPIVLKYFADRKNTNNLDRHGIQRETNNMTEQVSQSLLNFGRNAGNQSNGGGLLGGLFNNNDTRRQTNDKDDGLLDNLFDLFK